jgi:hypothetical protein
MINMTRVITDVRAATRSGSNEIIIVTITGTEKASVGVSNGDFTEVEAQVDVRQEAALMQP